MTEIFGLPQTNKKDEKQTTPRHIVIKLLKTKEKRKLHRQLEKKVHYKPKDTNEDNGK